MSGQRDQRAKTARRSCRVQMIGEDLTICSASLVAEKEWETIEGPRKSGRRCCKDIKKSERRTTVSCGRS